MLRTRRGSRAAGGRGAGRPGVRRVVSFERARPAPLRLQTIWNVNDLLLFQLFGKQTQGTGASHQLLKQDDFRCGSETRYTHAACIALSRLFNDKHLALRTDG